MPAREAPAEMLPSSTTAANRRKSVRSKCTAQVLDELPFCLWCRHRQRYENPSLRLLEATDNSVGMSNPIVYLAVVAAAFLLAGLVKGVTGLALPTVGVGLLSLAVPPAHAAALIVVPALITNVWLMISGPGLGSLMRRLWPMQLAICLGTWASASLMARSETAFASAALGVALIAYAAFGLMNVRVSDVPAWAEWWLGTFVGGATGIHYCRYRRVCNTRSAIPSGAKLRARRVHAGARPLFHCLHHRACLVIG